MLTDVFVGKVVNQLSEKGFEVRVSRPGYNTLNILFEIRHSKDGLSLRVNYEIPESAVIHAVYDSLAEAVVTEMVGRYEAG